MLVGFLIEDVSGYCDMTEKSLDIDAIRADFPVLAREIYDQKPLIYLDSAATTLKPKSVVDRVQRHYLNEVSNVHRGVHHLSEQATLAFESVRLKVKNLINASREQEVIFTKGTTDAINLVAQSYGRSFLKAGDEVLISHMEHHSNIVPWQMLCEEKGCSLKVIPITDTGEIDLEEFKNLLTDKVKMLSLVHTSNSLGTINPIKDMIKMARAYQVTVLVDGAQAIAHCPIDVQDLDCDFFAFSAHKMFAPTGVGVLYGREKLLEHMPPVQGGGDMIRTVSFEKTLYNQIPYKFEAGTPHIAGVIGLGAAIDYILDLDFQMIQRHEKDLLVYGTEALSSVSGLTLVGTASHKAPVFSFVLEGIHPHDIGTLVDQEGVAIRTGHHCTEPVMKRFAVPATARASLAMYNQKEDVDALLRAIEHVKSIFNS